MYRPEKDLAPTPAERGAGRFFYASGPIHSLIVQVPVSVELDNSFNGLELLGDTSMFKLLRISTGHGPVLIGQASTKTAHQNPNDPEERVNKDSLDPRIKAANIRIRVGIGPELAKRRLSFNSCKKVTCVSPIQGKKVFFMLLGVDSVQLNLDVEALECMSSWGGHTRPYLELSGNAGQAYFYHLENVHLSAAQLRTREAYIRGAYGSDLEIQATDIANCTILNHCSLQLTGNPTHRRIESTNPVSEHR